MSARHTRLATVAVLPLALLAACSGHAHSNVNPQPPSITSNIDPNRQPPAPPVDGAEGGGIVTVLTSTKPAELAKAHSLDPTWSYNTDTSSILSGLVTRSLTQFVYDPDQESMILVPDIATDLGTPNDDYTEWTYTVRPGVKFEDGSPVTADDVAYGIKRSFDRTTFKDGPTYSTDYFLHGDTYQGPYRPGTDDDGIIVHGSTLTLKMAKPFPEMPYWGALAAIGPIPEGRDDPSTYAQHPLATGPYKFKTDYHQGDSLTLVRNGEWDPATDPGRHQYVDEYRFRFGVAPSKIDATILTDASDAETTLTIDTPLSADLRGAPPRLITQGPGRCVLFRSLDTRKIPDPLVRQAIGTAFPFEEVVAAGGGLPGVSTEPGRALLPVGTPGRVSYNPLSTPPGEADPEAAKALLKQAGYDPGEFQLTFAFDASDPVEVAVKDALRKGFEAAGFRVKPYSAASPDQADTVQNDPSLSSPINVRAGGWCLDWPSGNASILPHLTSLLDESERFGTYFDEPSVDREANRITTLPLTQQPAAWGALDQEIETTYYPLVVTQYLRTVMLHGSRIGGMNADTITGMPTWKDLYVLHR